MQAVEAMFHEFHFVLDESLALTLQGLKQEVDAQGFTKFITGVLELLFPWLEYEHLFGKERQTRYRFVNDDPGVRRLHVHLDLPYSLYKRLKLMHQDLNFYSIAQLVRWLLGEFVCLTKQYGKRVREVVEGRLRSRCTAAGINLIIFGYSKFSFLITFSPTLIPEIRSKPLSHPPWLSQLLARLSYLRCGRFLKKQ